MSDQEIQSTRPGSSELVGQEIKFLQSGLIPFPKEHIDISLILLRKSLHRDVFEGDIFIYSV